MNHAFQNHVTAQLDAARQAGTFKTERVLDTPQGAAIIASAGVTAPGAAGGTASSAGSAGSAGAAPATAPRELLNLCANNYLGLAGDPRIIGAAQRAMDAWGFGLSSVRFICGTQRPHLELERQIAAYLGTEAAILYAAAFDANGGVFEPLLGEEDAIISDALNHASIIDGVRLCKARRYRYAHADMADLERQLQEAQTARFRLIVTDGVFSMDGDIAPLPRIVELARAYDAMVMVDESHASGFMGPTGRGTAEHFGLIGEIDIISTTFGKALGGAGGGCIAASEAVVALLRQRSRPYLFSNTVSPAVVGGSLEALRIARTEAAPRERLHRNAAYLRTALREAGFTVAEGRTPIIPVMLYEETTAVRMAEELFTHGVYVVAFSYPVVPRGQARIRIQASAAHANEQLKFAVDAFVQAGRRVGVV